MTSTLSRTLTLLVFAAALAACKTTVIGGRGADGGAGGVGGSPGGGGTGGYAIGPAEAIAEYAYMVGSPPDPGTGTTSSSGGPGVDPNTLYVRIGNYGPACGNDMPYTCSEPPVWQVSIGIPPALQAPGIYALGDPALISSASVSGGSGAGECWGGGGSFTNGTLEIVSNNGSTIVVRLAGTDGLFSEFSADGEYTAPICQWGLD